MNYFFVGISSCRPKNNDHDLHNDHHTIVFVFMLYYYRLDIDINGLCVLFSRVYWYNSNIIIWNSNT